MDRYVYWGRQVQRLGLVRAYEGIYFPLQYQAFDLALRAGHRLRLTEIESIKALNFVAELAIFVLLIVLLRRMRLDYRYAFIFWLHPYYLALNWLGYVDSHQIFFILSGLVSLAFLPRYLGLAACGVALGVAFLMKPQSAIPVLALGLFIGVLLLDKRTRRQTPNLLFLLAGPGLAFASYSLYFWLRSHPWHSLVASYLRVWGFFPSLSADMPNVWLPLAAALVQPGQRISEVREPKIFHNIALILTLMALLVIAVSVSRAAAKRTLAGNLVLLFGLATAVVPMVSTQAHENHLATGGLLMTLLVAKHRQYRWEIPALMVLLLLQFINLFGLYGFGENQLTEGKVVEFGIGLYRSAIPKLLVALGSVGIFALLFSHLLRRLWSPQGN